MDKINVFISIGATATQEQEDFVRAVEDRLRSVGLAPHTVGRNTFSADAPLKTLTELMDKCAGTLVIALERKYFPSGIERRGGPNETVLGETKFTTPWNQIEAAMAYSRGQPLMVIVEAGLKGEGLLDAGYDWYVQRMKPELASLNTVEFNGVLDSWKSKIAEYSTSKKTLNKLSVGDLTIGDLLKNLKPSQLWSILAALAALVAGSFALGQKLSSLSTGSQQPPARILPTNSPPAPSNALGLNTLAPLIKGTQVDL